MGRKRKTDTSDTLSQVPNLIQLKNENKKFRSQITILCKEINDVVDTGGSPGSLQVLVKHALAALEACDQVNTSIADATDDAGEVKKQFQMQLTYLRNVEDAKAKARDHTGSLIDDLSSTTSKQPRQKEKQLVAKEKRN